MNAIVYETRAVLAGAYANKTAEAKSMLTHAVDAQTERPFCRRVRAENIADAYAISEKERQAPPTCPVCRARDPRFTKVAP